MGSPFGNACLVAKQALAPNRDARIEDVEGAIYSALGINWTNVRYDDPFGRGFEYVPRSRDDLYAPIHELWG